jgi:thymidylate synthase
MYIQENTYTGFEPAYLDTLMRIKGIGSQSSPRGRATKELLGYQFSFENPRQRLISFKSREVNLYYCIGNFLWVMSQSDDVDFISYYNQRGNTFSDDGKRLPAAYGKRIFDIDGINQFWNCIRELKLDPDSRRAIISIHMPQHDWRGVLDTSCTSDFQMFIRKGKLYMINHMRSQSAAMVMPYDTFLMTMIQEYAANLLGIELGTYTNFCGNIHIFLDEEELVEKLFLEPMHQKIMKPMPLTNIEQNLKRLLQFERLLRDNAQIHDYHEEHQINKGYWLTELFKLKFPHYWNQICLILIVKAMDYTGVYYLDFVHDYIDDIYKPFLLK